MQQRGRRKPCWGLKVHFGFLTWKSHERGSWSLIPVILPFWTSPDSWDILAMKNFETSEHDNDYIQCKVGNATFERCNPLHMIIIPLHILCTASGFYLHHIEQVTSQWFTILGSNNFSITPFCNSYIFTPQYSITLW